MAFKFENLKIWVLASQLSNEIDLMTLTFQAREKYSLCTQIKKAADSVTLNIAEGSTGQSNTEFKRFLNYSIRSAIDVVSCLFLANGRQYIDDEAKQKYYNSYEVLIKMLTKLRDSL